MVNKNVIILAIIFLLFCSCQKNGKDINNSLNNADQRILYEIDPKISVFILDSLIKNKNIVYCEFFFDHANSITTISFPYFTYEQLDSTIVKDIVDKTNRHLVLGDREIPVVFFTDILYAKHADSMKRKINDFNFASIKIDAKGGVIESVAF